MQQTEYYLRSLTGKIRPRKFAVYDIETTTDLKRCYLVGFYDGFEYRQFESEPMRPEHAGSAIDQFMRWILKKGKDYSSYWLYGHNAGNFDALYVLKWLMVNRVSGCSYSIIPLQSSILMLDVRVGRYKWQFLDSYRLMKASLSDLCKTFNIPGKIEGIDYATLHQDPRRYEYLRRDCLALHECLTRFHGIIYDMGGDVGITAPSTAMATFRRRFLHSQIPINRHFPECENGRQETDSAVCNGCLHDFVRRGYSGGRVERFRASFETNGSVSGEAFVGDINSMYPSAMLGPMPVELKLVRQGEIENVDSYNRHWLGFVDCTVDVPIDTYLPVLPYRTKDKLLFPVGVFRGVFSSIELATAIKMGAKVVQWGKSVWFQGRAIFKDYVEHLYAYRDKSRPDYDSSLDKVAKDLLVSLYGKFGMNENRETFWFAPQREEIIARNMEVVGKLGSGIYKEDVRVRSTYVIPHIAAWVTSVARLKLHSLMQRMVDDGHKLYYCDTDSITTTAPVDNDTRLGELKLVGRIKRGRYIAPKFYLNEYSDGHIEVKAKGFSGGFGMRKQLDEPAFSEIVDYHQKVDISRMRKYREAIRGGEEFPSMMTTSKGITGIDSKRILLPDGNTRPVIIGKDIEV